MNRTLLKIFWFIAVIVIITAYYFVYSDRQNNKIVGGDKVTITSGFYAGCTGTVMKRDEQGLLIQLPLFPVRAPCGGVVLVKENQ
jgi:hypothetical protein